jgi:hypothetical protein
VIRHVIVEGPDGAGKTTLIGKLAADWPRMTIADRAVQSDGSRIPKLDQWVIESANSAAARPKSIHDRHAIISEPIYGTLVRHKLPGMFAQPWWVNVMMQRMAMHALLILCLPPLSHVRENVKGNEGDQMSGVVDNIDAVWHAYNVLPWPGVMMRYDYTTMNALTTAHIARKVIDGNR